MKTNLAVTPQKSGGGGYMNKDNSTISNQLLAAIYAINDLFYLFINENDFQ